MLQEIAIGATTAALAAGGYCYAALWPGSQIFGKTLIAGRNPREIALTFDDGPNDPYTLHLLDVLAKYNVRATFFMIGRFVEQRPEISRAVQSAGHLIGNHTMTHPWLSFVSSKGAALELRDCNAALEDVLGRPIGFFRPPHGARRPDVLSAAHRLGLVPVMWNAMGYDWKPENSSERISSYVDDDIQRNRRAGHGSNIVLHDGGHAGMGQDRSRTVAAVDSLLKQLSDAAAPGAMQVRFVTVDEWNQPGT